ncbi:MAG: alpha/beta hydrolase [Myxococcota bacterium]
MSGSAERERTIRDAEQERVWRRAWSAALPLVDGVARGRAPGAEAGVELAWLDWGGSGPLVVLLHANGFCAATWAPIAARLRRRYRVVAIDARGHGDSTSVAPEQSPKAYAWTTLARDVDRAVASILAQTGYARVALGVGHSMGGALLACDALERPGRYERLLLCDPVLLPPVPRAPDGEATHAGNPLAAATRKRRDRFPSAAAAYAHCRSRALYADFTPEALALYVGLGMLERADGTLELKCRREVEAAIFDNGGSLDLMPRIDGLSAEILILHAARGGFSRPYYEALAGRAPRARVASVDAGHLFPMDEPALVIDAVRRPTGAASQA